MACRPLAGAIEQNGVNGRPAGFKDIPPKNQPDPLLCNLLGDKNSAALPPPYDSFPLQLFKSGIHRRLRHAQPAAQLQHRRQLVPCPNRPCLLAQKRFHFFPLGCGGLGLDVRGEHNNVCEDLLA